MAQNGMPVRSHGEHIRTGSTTMLTTVLQMSVHPSSIDHITLLVTVLCACVCLPMVHPQLISHSDPKSSVTDARGFAPACFMPLGCL